MREFKTETGKDLLFTMSNALECWKDTQGIDSIRTRINALDRAVSTDDIVIAFYHCIKAVKSGVSKEEIEDAVFRVGLVNPCDSVYTQPYPLVFIQFAQDFETEQLEALKSKKAVSEGLSEDV